MEELKDCPCCGSKAEFGEHVAYSIDSSFDYVGCTECGLLIMWGTAEEWNRRVDKEKTNDA